MTQGGRGLPGGEREESGGAAGGQKTLAEGPWASRVNAVRRVEGNRAGGLAPKERFSCKKLERPTSGAPLYLIFRLSEPLESA